MLAFAIEGQRTRARAMAGLVFGFGLFGPTLFWISEFHGIGYVLVLLGEGMFLAGACAITPPHRLSVLIALPGAFALAEACRGAVPFGGLPMGGIGLGQAAGPLVPAARYGGALLVTFLTVVVALGGVELLRRRWRTGAALLLVPAACSLAGLVAPDGEGSGGRSIRFAIVQGGGPRGFRAVDSEPGAVLEAHLAVSQTLAPPLDLVVWPEDTIDVAAIEGSVEADAVAAVARRLEATVIAGVTEDVGETNFQNVAVAWDPDGKIVGRYVKARRVPFGEYVPARGFLDNFVDLRVLPRDAVAGRGTGVLTTPAGKFGVAISYEVFFGDRSRSAVRGGGEVLLVPTNAASFTSSQVPTQEVAAARLRAWETGRWVLQSAPTGYGAVIDPHGNVVARTTLGRAEVLKGRAEIRTAKTLYVRFGDTPLVLLSLALVALAWLLATRSRLLVPPRRASGRSVSACGSGSRGRRR